jgi:hypothetical protein
MVEVEAVIGDTGHDKVCVWGGGSGGDMTGGRGGVLVKLHCASVASSASNFRLLEMALDFANMKWPLTLQI